MIDPKIEFNFEVNANEQKAQWIVPKTLPYFDGHFPDNPILPAVAVIDASAELLRRFIGVSKVTLESVKSCKFTSPILPGNRIEISFQEQVKNEWRISWSTRNEQELTTPCAQLTLLLQ